MFAIFWQFSKTAQPCSKTGVLLQTVPRLLLLLQYITVFICSDMSLASRLFICLALLAACGELPRHRNRPFVTRARVFTQVLGFLPLRVFILRLRLATGCFGKRGKNHIPKTGNKQSLPASVRQLPMQKHGSPDFSPYHDRS